MLLEPVAAAIPWLLIVIGTAAAVGCYLARRYELAVGILFLLASMSRFAVDVAGSGVRLEQPAVIAIAGIVLVRERAELGRLIRRAWIPAALAMTYLGAHLLSSAFVAPDPVKSLKIVAWLAISMAAAGITALVATRTWHRALRDLARWILTAASIHVGVAVVAVGSQVWLGTDWGVQSHDVLIGKAFGLSYEANLFGILLATALPLALVPGAHTLRLSPIQRAALVGWLAVGLGLAYSRGPILAFAGAMGVAVVVLAFLNRRTHRPGWIGTSGAIGASAIVVLLVAVGTIQVQDAFARMGARDGDGIVVVGDIPAPTSGERPTRTNRPDETPSPSEAVKYVGTGDTIALRMRNSIRALAEVPDSPIVGLGTDSYGQRHVDAGCQCPSHISNLSVATLYEAGIVGSIALVGLLAFTAVAVWQLGAWGWAAALIAMIAGYQATDAFRFAISWILIGAILGVWAASREGGGAEPGPQLVVRG
jgi:hypothetical protein